MFLSIPGPLVSVDWLSKHLNNPKLFILNCTIPKVGEDKLLEKKEEKKQIKNAIFFDIKNTFSNKKAPFPNTMLSAHDFEEQAQSLGINKDSIIVCYDNLGIYSAPRVWWMFQVMGFSNIAVLNGGFPEWKKHNFPQEIEKVYKLSKGNFQAIYNSDYIKFTENVLKVIKSKDVAIIDARSKDRFYGIVPEPRKEIQSGHIPNSINIPYKFVLNDNKMKSAEELNELFKNVLDNKSLIFSCGSGITACILALAANIAGYKNFAVFDGSWTEWGSRKGLPIEC